MASVAAATACDGPGMGGGGGLGGSRAGKEKWTIRCAQSAGPDHKEHCEMLADLLRNVRELRASDVRVVTTDRDSTVYYGQYGKVASPDGNRLVFPPEYQRDIELIRRLSANQYTPFFGAVPELIGGPSSSRGEWDVSDAKGAYTLQIAFLYNTPTFDQRIQAAEEWVRVLREEGYKAFYRHDVTRSFVYVGEFGESAVVRSPDGRQVYSPEVERFIARNEAQFRHVSENGHIVRRPGPSGELVSTPSFLVPIPKREEDAVSWDR